MHTKPYVAVPCMVDPSCVLLPCVQVSPQQQAQRLSVAYNNLGGILKMQGLTLGAITCYEHVAVLQVLRPKVFCISLGLSDFKPDAIGVLGKLDCSFII